MTNGDLSLSSPMNTRGLSPEEFTGKMEELVKLFVSLIRSDPPCRDAVMIQEWLAISDLCLSALDNQGGEVLDEKVWGLDNIDPINIRGDIQGCASTILQHEGTLLPELNTRLVSMAQPKYEIRLGCKVTHDWFSSRIPSWKKHLARFKGAGPLRFLEIGSFEGLATCWLLENILYCPESSISCIDLFEGLHNELFTENVCGFSADRVHKLRGRSQHILPLLTGQLYDFIYIDGSHNKRDVLQDAVLSWTLLRPGALLIFDDYRLKDSFLSRWLPNEKPDVAIDAFLDVYSDEMRVLAKEQQVIVEKNGAPGIRGNS